MKEAAEGSHDANMAQILERSQETDIFKIMNVLMCIKKQHTFELCNSFCGPWSP